MSRQSPRVSYATGPDVLGASQVKHFDKRWAAWFGSKGVRIEKTAFVAPPADNRGEKCEVFPDELANHITLAFDQDGRPVVGIEAEPGWVEVRRRQGATQTKFRWEGYQPQLFLNWLVRYYPRESDVVCFYLKEDRRKLYARFQRENFGVEYLMNTLHTTAAEMQETDAIGFYQWLWGRNEEGKKLTLVSRRYPPFPALASDKGKATQTLYTGLHEEAVKLATGADTGKGSTTFQTGELEDIVKHADAGSEDGQLQVAFEDGAHILTVNPPPEEADAGQTNTTLLTGLYWLVVVNGGSSSDKGKTSGTFLAGSYGLVVVAGGEYPEKANSSTAFLEGAHFTP